MYEMIEEANVILKAQQAIEKQVQESSTKSGKVKLGYQGGGRDVMVHFLGGLNFWVGFADSGNRYWNALGLGNPFRDGHTIVAEINPPKSGIDRRISGAILSDRSGQIYLAHRGGVGGGRKGIGKQAFMSWYPGAISHVRDGDQISEMIIIDALDSPDLLKKLAAFTTNASTFKEVAVFKG